MKPDQPKPELNTNLLGFTNISDDGLDFLALNNPQPVQELNLFKYLGLTALIVLLISLMLFFKNQDQESHLPKPAETTAFSVALR